MPVPTSTHQRHPLELPLLGDAVTSACLCKRPSFWREGGIANRRLASLPGQPERKGKMEPGAWGRPLGPSAGPGWFRGAAHTPPSAAALLNSACLLPASAPDRLRSLGSSERKPFKSAFPENRDLQNLARRGAGSPSVVQSRASWRGANKAEWAPGKG